MKTSFDPPGSELEFLGVLLDQAARYAQAKIDGIPESATVEEEMEAIEAVIAPAAAIAEHIMACRPMAERGAEVQRLAQAWLDGSYTPASAQAA